MRCFVASSQIAGNIIEIRGDDAEHIKKVLRMRVGEAVTACDETLLHSCVIEAMQKDAVLLRIIESGGHSGEPTVSVTVYAGLSKGDRFEYLLQKCVETGAARIVPFISERCIARPKPQDYESKRSRFARIALEASKQSERAKPVDVGQIVTFAEALDDAAAQGVGLFLYEREHRLSLSEILRQGKNERSFAVVCGPEGGFSEGEVALAVSKELHAVSIGPRILRCETAPVAALCAVMYETGNFDVR